MLSTGCAASVDDKSAMFIISQQHLHNTWSTHVIFEPLDFIAKLTALEPKLRVNLNWFHSVLPRNSATNP